MDFSSPSHPPAYSFDRHFQQPQFHEHYLPHSIYNNGGSFSRMPDTAPSLPEIDLAPLATEHPSQNLMRTVNAVGMGVADGVAEEIAKIAQHPTEALKGVGIGLVATSLVFAGAKGGYLKTLLTLVATASAAVEIAPKYEDVKAGLVGSWNGTLTQDEAALDLRPLGHFASTFALARGTDYLATEKLLVPWLKLSGR